MADIPPELFDIIIDHLHDDRSSLKACSLVCHAWLDSSRYHLFHDFNVTPSDYLAFKAVLESGKNMGSTISRHIRSLCFDTGDSLDSNLLDILNILEMLSSLGCLRLSWHNLIPAPLEHTCLPNKCTSNRELKTLHLFSFWGNSLNPYLDILAVLHIYGKVNALYLEVIGAGPEGLVFDEFIERDPFPNITSPIVVRSLTLSLPPASLSNASYPYRFISKYIDTNALRCVAIQTRNSLAIPACGEFLRDSGRAIESFTLYLAIVENGDQERVVEAIQRNNLHISACTNLQSFRFTLDYHDEHAAVTYAMHESVLDLLSEISSHYRSHS